MQGYCFGHKSQGPLVILNYTPFYTLRNYLQCNA